MPQISISATNPCHLYPLACALHEKNHLAKYYSGYPTWKLPELSPKKIAPHSLRTLITYGLLKFFSKKYRPKDRTLFLWQDHGFDSWVAKNLQKTDILHAMPGQCLKTFQAAKKQHTITVLNHATGPVQKKRALLEKEYRRVGLEFKKETFFDEIYFAREAKEYALADYHCVASNIVKEQLIEYGIEKHKIKVIPYGADIKKFTPPTSKTRNQTYHIAFAGQLTLRKGVRFLLKALQQAKQPNWEMHFYGSSSPETTADIAAYQGASKLHFHGNISQENLAKDFQKADVLILPSLEEGFGLVIPQALASGLPCIVSQAVGAKDLIQEKINGSIIETSNPTAIQKALQYWSQHSPQFPNTYSWEKPAQELIQWSKEICPRS